MILLYTVYLLSALTHIEKARMGEEIKDWKKRKRREEESPSDTWPGLCVCCCIEKKNERTATELIASLIFVLCWTASSTGHGLSTISIFSFFLLVIDLLSLLDIVEGRKEKRQRRRRPPPQAVIQTAWSFFFLLSSTSTSSCVIQIYKKDVQLVYSRPAA